MRYVSSGVTVQEFLCCIKLKKSTMGKDISDVLNEFLVKGGLSWSKCITICTDGAKAMTEHVRGLIGLIRQVNKNILFTHCMIHRGALASKELGSELMVATNHVVKIVNSLKSKPKVICLFRALCKEMGVVHEHLLLHTEVC